MKVSSNNNNTKASRKVIVPPIPLECPEWKEFQKGNFITIELKSMPTNKNSQVYKREVPYFDQGTPEEFIDWLTGLEAVLVGQNIMTPENKMAMARRLLKGDVLRVYENFINGLPLETPETPYEDSIKALAVHVFPIHALRLQKQYMRRFLRKPMATMTREFVARVQQINNYLEYFPPFTDEQNYPKTNY
jgi:hypothetical protein